MRFTGHLLIWSLATLLLHIVLQEFILPKEWAFRAAYRAHALLWALTIAEHKILHRLKKSNADMIGMAYLAGAMLKSAAGFLYLLPLLLHVDERTRPVALWFFLPFFSSLIFQAIQAVGIVRSVS